VRQQHLRRAQLMRAEAGFVNLREAHLADGGAGLQFVDIGGALLKAQAQHALGDRAGRHQYHLLAQCAQACDLRGPARDGSVIESAAIIGDQRRSNLDDDAGSFLYDRIHGCDNLKTSLGKSAVFWQAVCPALPRTVAAPVMRERRRMGKA
jgi:hypothetical protein